MNIKKQKLREWLAKFLMDPASMKDGKGFIDLQQASDATGVGMDEIHDVLRSLIEPDSN